MGRLKSWLVNNAVIVDDNVKNMTIKVAAWNKVSPRTPFFNFFYLYILDDVGWTYGFNYDL